MAETLTMRRPGELPAQGEGNIMNKPVKQVKRSRRPTKADQRAATMEQIYDAAEELFSKRGLYGVTLKEVATQVGVHQSLLQ